MAAVSRKGARPSFREGAVLSGYLLLALLYTGLWSDVGTRFLAGDDPVQDAWVLDTVTRNLLGDPLRLYQGNLFYPAHDCVLFADPILGPAVTLLPLRAFSANPVLLYNAALLLGLAGSSYGFYRLGTKLFGDPAAALLAGIAVPYTAQQMHHMQLGHVALLSIQALPFLLLALVELVERPRAGAAILTGVAFAYQATTDGYYALCSAILCLLVAAWAWRSFRGATTWAFAALAALVGVLLVLPQVLGFAGLEAEAEMTRGLEWSRAYSNDLGTSLLRSDAYLWRGILSGPTNQGGPLFPGLAALIFAGLGLRRREGPYLRLLGLILAVFFILSLGPELRVSGRAIAPLPFKLLFEHVPFFDAIRHPITFAVPALMALALLAVRGLAASGLARRPAALAAILLASVAETLVPTPRRMDRGAALPDVYAFLQRQPHGGILELPFENRYTYEWWALHHRMPVVNGALAFEPRWYAPLQHLIGREWGRRPARQDMEDWASVQFLKGQLPIRYLVLHPGVSGYVAANVEATSRTFEPIHVSTSGARVFRVHRGGTGAFLKRRFRDDQLGEGLISATLRGPEGARVTVAFNDAPIESRALKPEAERVTWRLPAGSVKRGLNVLSLKTDGDARLELLEVEAGGGRPRDRGRSVG